MRNYWHNTTPFYSRHSYHMPPTSTDNFSADYQDTYLFANGYCAVKIRNGMLQIILCITYLRCFLPCHIQKNFSYQCIRFCGPVTVTRILFYANGPKEYV